MWYKKTVQEVFNEFSTSGKGLTDVDANERLKIQGKNVLPKGETETLFKLFVSQFIDPIIIILIVTIALSMIIGEYLDAFFITLVILLDAFLGTFQEWRAVNNAALLQNMLKDQVKVIRSGVEKIIDSEELVTGDVVVLESGEKITADLRIIEAYNLTIDEASLTGESIATEKQVKEIVENTVINNQNNMVFAGTSVVRGRGMGVVVASKEYTEFGKIADKVINAKSEKSPLVLRMDKFTKDISKITVFISLALVIVLYFKGYAPRELFFVVVALAISAIPEGLHLAMTMCLTIASNKMMKKNVLVKKLNSVESLGSCTIIASDKTGTLTFNEQTAKIIMLPNKTKHSITGSGYNADGKVLKENVQTKEISFLGFINNESFLEKDDKEWIHHGDSIDVAFKALGYKSKIKLKTKIIFHIPYESENKYSAVFYEDKDRFSTAKGSVETIVGFCNKMQVGKTTAKINLKLINEQNEELARKGYRVIAVAKGKVRNNQRKFSNKDLKGMTFIGLVGFIDPLRPDAKKAIRQCHLAGIKTIMITGDHPLTSYTIAKELGILKKESEVVTGDELDKYIHEGTESLATFIKNKKVFSRVTSIQKYEIVNAYKFLGEFIAVTGDGVNDAPALKTANIGIAMGSGTDVAKETSTMVIADDSFASIVNGVEEGRVAYSNVRKIIYMLLSCGVAEILFFFFAIIFGYPLPLLAIQLLWLNLVTDGIQDVALAYEKKNDDVMNEKPRRPDEKIFNKLLIQEILLSGVYMALAVFLCWIFLIDVRGIPVDNARGYILLLMVFMQNVHVFNCRSETKSAFKIPIKNNYFIVISIVLVLLIQLIVSEIPFLAHILKTESVPWKDTLVLIALALPIVIIMDLFKSINEKKKNQK